VTTIAVHTTGYAILHNHYHQYTALLPTKLSRQ